MKPILLLYIALALSAASSAQTKKQLLKKISLGVILSPDVCYRSLQNNDGSSVADIIIGARNNTEITKAGFTGGVNLSVKISKRLVLETGLQYAQKGYRTKLITPVSAQPDPLIPATIRYVYNYNYFDIPLMVKYTVGKKRLLGLAGAGFTTHLLLKETQISWSKFSDGRTVKKKEFLTLNKAVNLSPTLSAGLGWRAGSRLQVRAEPVFRFAAFKSGNTPVAERFWSAGLNMSCYMQL
jgi:hypothetical protein